MSERAAGPDLVLAGGEFVHILVTGLDPESVARDAVHDDDDVNTESRMAPTEIFGGATRSLLHRRPMVPKINNTGPPES